MLYFWLGLARHTGEVCTSKVTELLVHVEIVRSVGEGGTGGEVLEGGDVGTRY